MRAKENPFRTSRLNRLPFQFRRSSVEDLMERLKESAWRGAIVGPHGSGKTTLLNLLMDRLKVEGHSVRHARLDDRMNRLPSSFLEPAVDKSEILCIDGYDLLSWRERSRIRRMVRKAQGVLIVSHREGWLPTLYRCSTSVGLLKDLTEELADVNVLERLPDLDALYHCKAGNLREVFLSLYDVSAGFER